MARRRAAQRVRVAALARLKKILRAKTHPGLQRLDLFVEHVVPHLEGTSVQQKPPVRLLARVRDDSLGEEEVALHSEHQLHCEFLGDNTALQHGLIMSCVFRLRLSISPPVSLALCLLFFCISFARLQRLQVPPARSLLLRLDSHARSVRTQPDECITEVQRTGINATAHHDVGTKQPRHDTALEAFVHHSFEALDFGRVLAQCLKKFLLREHVQNAHRLRPHRRVARILQPEHSQLAEDGAFIDSPNNLRFHD